MFRSLMKRNQSPSSLVVHKDTATKEDKGQVNFSSDGYVEYNIKHDQATNQDVDPSNQPDCPHYQDIPTARDAQQRSADDGTANIQFSSDKYVKYNTGGDDAPYQGIYSEPDEAKQRVSAAYVNAAMIKSNDRADLDEYEEVKSVY